MLPGCEAINFKWVQTFHLKCCNLIGLEYFCSRTNPGIGLAPDLPFFTKVGLHPTRASLHRLILGLTNIIIVSHLHCWAVLNYINTYPINKQKKKTNAKIEFIVTAWVHVATKEIDIEKIWQMQSQYTKTRAVLLQYNTVFCCKWSGIIFYYQWLAAYFIAPNFLVL